VPLGSEPDVVVTVSVATVMVMLKFAEVVCCGLVASVTVTVTLNVPPEPPGVPEMVPDAGSMPSPGGSEEPA